MVHIAQVVCVLFLVSVASVSGALYGILTGGGGNGTQTNVYTVAIDTTTGNFTIVAENFVNIGDSATYDGISAFDQKNEYLYYVTDFGSAFVFGVDVKNGLVRPPISTGAMGITAIEYDAGNEQLLLTSIYNETTNEAYIISFPSDPSKSSKIVFNFTQHGVDANSVYRQTIDPSTDVYYLIYYGSGLQLGQFTISDPNSFKSVAFPCAGGDPIYINYDIKQAKFVGLMMNQKGTDYIYYEIADNKCTEINLKLGGIVTAVTYDPTATSLYFSWATNEGSAVEVYDTSSHQLSSFAVDDVLEDIEVAYSA